MSNLDFESVFLGTIYGNCIGDAVGLLTEFLSKDEAKEVSTRDIKLHTVLKEALNIFFIAGIW